MKAQVSHLFIFTLGIIILALIIFFGYKVVQELGAKGEDTALIRFKTKLVNDIKILKEGDVYLKSYILPKGYREVCFVDKEHELDGAARWYSEFYGHLDQFETDEPKVSNAISDNVKENVFVVGEKQIDSFLIGTIDLGTHTDDSPYFVYCFEIKNSRLNILLKGQGNNVLVNRTTE